MTSESFEVVYEGNYFAKVLVREIPDNGAWGPYLSVEDAMKVERVRRALQAGDVKEAAKDAKVYELSLLAGE